MSQTSGRRGIECKGEHLTWRVPLQEWKDHSAQCETVGNSGGKTSAVPRQNSLIGHHFPWTGEVGQLPVGKICRGFSSQFSLGGWALGLKPQHSSCGGGGGGCDEG